MKKTRKPGGGRKKLKPEYDAGKNLKEQMDAAVALYGEECSLQSIADALNLNPIKVRKLLITAGVYESEVAEKVQATFEEYRETQDYKTSIKKHGISFKSAARIFFDYDRIEFYDEDHSYDEDRYNTIGDTSAGRISQKAEGALIGNIDQFIGKVNEILFVVYTERVRIEESGTKTDVTRLISARMATEFERGLYYGKNE